MQTINIIMIYYWDKKLQKKKVACPGSWYDNKQTNKQTNKKHWFDVSSSKDAFLQDVLQITAIVLVLVKNHYHIYGLNLFWDTL